MESAVRPGVVVAARLLLLVDGGIRFLALGELRAVARESKECHHIACGKGSDSIRAVQLALSNEVRNKLPMLMQSV